MKYVLEKKYDYTFKFLVIEIEHKDMIKEIACFKYIDDANNFINYSNSRNVCERIIDKSVTKKIYIIINVLETDPEGNIEIEDDLING